MLFIDRLRANCLTHGSKAAIIFRDGDASETVSYESLLRRTVAAAAWLAQHGVLPGDRVAVCLPKSLAGVELHLAACSMGAVSMPLNPAYSVPELEYLLRDSEARVLIIGRDPSRNAMPSDGLGKTSTPMIPIDVMQFAGSLPVPDQAQIKGKLSHDDPALMLYTSGTTGRPKGACMSHGSLTANMDMLGDAWQWSSEDVLLHGLPLYHVHGLLVALHGALHAGATSIVHSSFKVESILRDLEDGACTVFMAVPTMYRRILASLGDRRVDLRHMRLLTSGSDRLPIEVFEAIEHQLGHRVVERYGMTETGIMLSNPIEGDRVPGQVGLPLSGVQMRIVDQETASPVGTGVVGEFQTKGPHLFSGYWRDPEKTQRCFTEDGWFRTGDLGQQDGRGRFELKGRTTDLIISGGFNVYPTEVEHVLARHVAVEQCAVVGVPDAEWGEAVTAFVVRKNADITDGELVRHCRASLASYKSPKHVVFVEDLPRNAMGKVRKTVLSRMSAGPAEGRS